MTTYQFLPPLTPEERAALRESIATFGILQPVIVDEDGAVIDGHHRAEIATELGIDYPKVIVPGLSEEQKIEQALVLNLARRHLAADQKQALVEDLRARGLSVRWISERTGIPRSTVHRLSGVPNGTPEYIGGRDGKQYRAKRPMPTLADLAEAQADRATAEVRAVWSAFVEFTTGEQAAWADDLGRYALRSVCDWTDCDRQTFERVREGEESRGDPLPFDWAGLRDIIRQYEFVARRLEEFGALGNEPSFDEWRTVIARPAALAHDAKLLGAGDTPSPTMGGEAA